MGCCFSSQASNASSRHDEQGQHTAPPPQQNSHAQTNGSNSMPQGPPTPPTAEPAVIPGNDGTINEAVGQSLVFPRAESSSSASDQHVILEPTVYVPPSRPSVAAELEDAVVHSLPPEPLRDGARSTSSSSSSSSSG
ncbi:hypothetical protein HDV63DRAFT_241443 [Trichoderma sp. SZMC 28014]